MPRYNLENKRGVINAKKNVDYHASKGHVIDQKHIKKTRSNLQNRSLHLYYKLVAEALLEVGYNFIYRNPFTGDEIEVPYTEDLVKKRIWQPLQETLFKIESTTKLETHMINDILTVLTPWITNINKYVSFPNKNDLLIKQMNELDK